MASTREEDFSLVDVRQPDEYEAGHIPGARLLPLSEFERRLFELTDERDLVFYCHSGKRSAMASMLASEAELTPKHIYSLRGGFAGWEGDELTGYPAVAVFEGLESDSDFLRAAMDLEKGAELFYERLTQIFNTGPIASALADLAKVEIAHARLLYQHLKRIEPELPPFQTLYDGFPGEILEGGQRLEDALARIVNDDRNPCITALETAIDIEHAAYDLYKIMAEGAEGPTRRALLDIAQAEKAHMRKLAELLPACTPQ
jgi:rhodanese-related sulfurtransferase/rubrerythrin